MHEWAPVVMGVSAPVLARALTFCKLTMAWPPSVAEFITVCEREAGMPTCEEVYQACLQRNLTHALTNEVYRQIGSWAFSNDSEKDLRRKVQAAYTDIVHQSRVHMAGGS